ncbi:MAG: DUF2057 domain-containing protein [bacterium]|nr:DUF2057 domain-containing protein [bacterium]
MRLYTGPERPSEEIARLYFVESLEVTSVNGEHVPGIPRIMRSGERRLDLLPGGYDVVVHYDAIWSINTSEDEGVRSESRRVSLELEAGHSYRVEHRRLIDIEDARSLARDLEVSIVDLSGGQPVRLPARSRPTVVKKPVVVSPILEVGGGDRTQEASRSSTALRMLKFWWQEASPEERVQFRRSIAE